MTLRDFTQEDSSSFTRDLFFAFTVGFLVIMLLRVMVTYTQSKVSHNAEHPLYGSESHDHGLKAEKALGDTSRLNANIRTTEPTEE